jgi:hypothetical protein
METRNEKYFLNLRAHELHILSTQDRTDEIVGACQNYEFSVPGKKGIVLIV